jgi:hypothetical protein
MQVLISLRKSMRLVSSVLRNGLPINAMISFCLEMGAGDGWRCGVGAWLENRSQYWTLRKILFAGACVMGVFGCDCSLGGGG